MLPDIFCPQCGRYLGLRKACTFCGYERPVAEPLPNAEGLLWRSRAGEGRVMGLARAGELLAVALLSHPSVIGQEYSGQLALLDAATGRAHPLIPLPAAPTDPPAVLGDRLFLRLEGGQLLALALPTGENLWQCREPWLQGRGTLLPTPQALYLGSNEGRLHALSPTDGTPLWPDPPQARKSITAAPSLYRRRLFFGDRAGYLYACDPRTGRSLWPEPLRVGWRIETPPVPAGDLILAVGSRPGGGELCAVNLATGEVRWRATLPGEVRAAPLIVGQDVHLITRRGKWLCLNLLTGEEVERREFGAEVVATPIHVGGAIIFGLGDGRLLFVDAEEREQKAVWQAKGRIRATPAVGAESLFVGDDAGWISALCWHRGKWEWAADWYARRGRYRDAAAGYALAGDVTNDLSVRRRHHETAMHLWLEHDPLKAARFAETLSSLSPAEVAALLEDAATRLAARRPWQASSLLWRAADLYAEAGQLAEQARCRRAITRLERSPNLVVRPLTWPHFVAGQVSMLALAVRNRGNGQAQEVRVRLGGVLNDCLTFVLDTLQAGQEVELRANIIPTGPGMLRVETVCRDERGHEIHAQPLEQQIETGLPAQPIQVEGQVGVLTVRYAAGTRPPEVRVEGTVREVRYEAVEA